MQYTNKLKLPQAIYDAIVNDEYDRGESDITVTQLIQPVQMTKLQMEYEDKLVEDIADNIYALMGKSIHYILEKAESIMPVEKRLYIDIDGVKLGGQLDRLALISKDGGFSGKVQDYKIASVWEYIHGLNKEKEEQLNCLAYILNQNNYPVSELEIIMIFRDWQKSKAKYDKDYPQQQIAIINISLWPIDNQKAFIEHKIMHFQSDYIFGCTDNDKWATNDVYAVKNNKQKKALKLFSNYEDAADYVSANVKADSIETRKGENKRCDSYCNVKDFCPQYAKLRGILQ
jgi:hypothetical protein